MSPLGHGMKYGWWCSNKSSWLCDTAGGGVPTTAAMVPWLQDTIATGGCVPTTAVAVPFTTQLLQSRRYPGVIEHQLWRSQLSTLKPPRIRSVQVDGDHICVAVVMHNS